MAFVPAAQTVMAELRFNYGAKQVENTLYFQASAGVTTANMQALALNLKDWWNLNLKGILSNTLSLREVYVTDLTTNTSQTVSFTTGLPLAATGASEPLPANCSMSVSFRTAQRGRSARGRNYIVGMMENHTNGDTIDSGWATTVRSAYQLLVGAGTFSTGWQWCVVSRYSGGVARGAALVIPITSVIIVDYIVDSQRRRLLGRGK